MNFKIPEIEDRTQVNDILKNFNINSCDFCFGNIFIWSEIYNTHISFFNDSMIIRYLVDGEYSYSFCATENDLPEVIDELLENADKHNQLLRIYGISKRTKELIENVRPGCFEFTEMRDYFDYVYNTEDLINLSGRKYHQKRNHISYFNNNYKWEYERIDESNIDECRAFNSQWERHNSNKNPEELYEENKAIQSALDNYKELGFVGGILKVDGKIEAYTLGEPLSDEMFCTHIEKANADMRGAYPMINQQFALNELQGYKYVNREEDTGSDGLRQAKLSYHPEFLVESYFARYIK